MVKHTLQIEVEAPDELSGEDVEKLVDKLLNAGLSDAADSVEIDTEDEDAQLAIDLNITSPKRVVS